MALYNQTDPYTGETEEQRRRRLAAEQAQAQAQAQDQESGLSQRNPDPGFGDIVGQAFDVRMGGLEDRLNTAKGYFTDPKAALQQRLAQNEDAANTEVQTQTTKTYGDGSQEQIVKTQMPAPGAVAPEAAPAPAPAAGQAPAQGAGGAIHNYLNITPQGPAGEPAPAVPQQQAVIPPEAANQTFEMPALPQPGPPVQVAAAPGAPLPQTQAAPAPAVKPEAVAPTAMPPAAAPGASLAQMNQAYTPTVERQTEFLTPEQIQRQTVVDAHNEKDPARRQQMMAKILSTGDEASQRLAKNIIAEDYLKEKGMREAEKKIEEASPTELARFMKDRGKEGSYVKAILFARLGLNELAKREQELLNPDLKMDTATVGADKYTVVRDDRGGIVKAFDTDGREVGQKTLAKISAAATPSKSYLLPQSAGGLMQKTITGPDGREQVITGQVFTDPQTRETYFQAGTTRYDTTGLSTPAQNVQNVYGAAGAKQQATQAAQTGTSQGPLPPMVAGAGGETPAATVATTAGDPAAARRAQTDIESLDKEIKRLKPNAPGAAKTLETLQTERAAAQQRLQAASGTGGVPAQAVTGGQQPGESFVAYQERIKREGAAATAATTANIDLSKEERSNFLTYEEKEIIPKADASGNISRIRKQQLKGPDGILNNPEIVGMMSGQGTQAQEFANLIRDTVTGGIKDDELSRRVNLLGVKDPILKGKIYNQLALNNSLAPETLKANAGAGSVSDAEQTANRRNNIDITRVPLYTAVTMLGRDQFEKDTIVARQAFRTANPNLTTVRAFNDAWGKEKERLQGEYDRIYEARARYIAKYSTNEKPNPFAITEAYKQFPVPEFSRDGGWNYGTEFARKAARKPLDSFNR